MTLDYSVITYLMDCGLLPISPLFKFVLCSEYLLIIYGSIDVGLLSPMTTMTGLTAVNERLNGARPSVGILS